MERQRWLFDGQSSNNNHFLDSVMGFVPIGFPVERIFRGSNRQCQLRLLSTRLNNEHLSVLDIRRLMSLKYDCRLHLEDLSQFDTCESTFELDETEKIEEQMADEIRWEDLQNIVEENESEDEFSQANDGAAIPFSYDEANGSVEDEYETASSSDESRTPYEPPEDLKIPVGITLPSNTLQSAIIERTASFVAAQGSQMEIVIKARQRNTDKFDFLDWEHKYHHFYKFMVKMIKSGTYKPTIVPEQPRQKRYRRKRSKAGEVRDKVDLPPQLPAPKPTEPSNISDDDSNSSDGGYLHPSLRGSSTRLALDEYSNSSSQITEAKVDRKTELTTFKPGQGNDMYSMLFKNIAKIHNIVEESENLAKCTTAEKSHTPTGKPPDDRTLWHKWFYGLEPESDNTNHPNFKDATVQPPPPETSVVINKTAEFVAKFGPAAEQHLLDKSEIPLDFLAPSNKHYAFYQRRLKFMTGEQYSRKTFVPPPGAASQEQAIPSPPIFGYAAPPPPQTLPSYHGYHYPPPLYHQPPPPPNMPQLVSTTVATIDNRAMVSTGGSSDRPLISTMRFDELHQSPSTSNQPPPPPCDAEQETGNSFDPEKQKQNERRMKAQQFLATILKEKRIQRETDEAKKVEKAKSELAKAKEEAETMIKNKREKTTESNGKRSKSRSPKRKRSPRRSSERKIEKRRRRSRSKS